MSSFGFPPPDRGTVRAVAVGNDRAAWARSWSRALRGLRDAIQAELNGLASDVAACERRRQVRLAADLRAILNRLLGLHGAIADALRGAPPHEEDPPGA